MKKREIAENIVKDDDCSIVDYCTICPFYDDCDGCNYVELAKKYLEGLKMTEQELYQKWQKEWVEFHNVEVGDVVKVVAQPVEGQCGYEYCRPSNHVGDNVTVARIGSDFINLRGNNSCYNLPFFCLEFVRKAEKKVDKMISVKGKNYSEDTLQEMIKAYTEE